MVFRFPGGVDVYVRYQLFDFPRLSPDEGPELQKSPDFQRAFNYEKIINFGCDNNERELPAGATVIVNPCSR